METKHLREVATETEKKYLDAYEEVESLRGVARALDCSYGTVHGAFKRMQIRAARRGHAPGHWDSGVAPGYGMGKVTVQRNKYGEVARVWERQLPEAMQEKLEELSCALKQDLPQVASTRAPRHTEEDLMTVLPMGDPHFGMYAWARECGEAFNLEIAKEDLCAATDYLVKQAPRSGRCVIINLGDFFHADNMEGRTSGGRGHQRGRQPR